MLALSALGFALIAAPGGLVWLTIWVPALRVPDEGLLSLLADVVTIPTAVASWLFASGSTIVAGFALVRRRGGRTAALALLLGTPGTVLGTVLVVVVVAQLGTSLGLVPSAPDRQREVDAQAVATHLALPTSGARLIDRCEDREGVFNHQRRLSVIERWSQPRLDQIRGRLRDYSLDFTSGPPAPSDQTRLSFTGTDTRGNHIDVYVSHYLAGTTVYRCGNHTRLDTEAMQTEILLSS